MMQELIFATGNANKVSEIQAILGEQFAVKSMKDITLRQAQGDGKLILKEPFFTLEENAKTKAEQLQAAIGKDCFAEDSGLFVNALNGEPGVFSARYSGEDATDQKNIDLLLQNLKNQEDRTAYFKTIIHLIQDGTHHSFAGICKGKIIASPVGSNGFGYDPIFVADDIPELTFAQLSKAEKNTISHRAKATALFVEFLQANS